MSRVIVEAQNFVLGEALTRMYYRDKEGTRPVPVKSVMYEKMNEQWFFMPTREPFLKNTSIILDDFLEKDPYRESYDYLAGMEYTHVRMRLTNEDNKFVEEYEPFWNIIRGMYLELKRKVYDKIIDAGVAESYEELENLRYYYFNHLTDRIAVPRTEEERNNLVTFLISYIVLINNFQDIFYPEIAGMFEGTAMTYLEGTNYSTILNPNLVVPKELSIQIMYVVSSPEMYLMNDYPQLFGVPEDESRVREVKKILNQLEENYTPSVRIMEASRLRQQIIDGYVVGMLNETNTASGTVKEGSIQRAFYLMRKGAAEAVIRDFAKDTSTKSNLRKTLEKLLIDWYEMYKNGLSVSIPIVNKRIDEFVSKYRNTNVDIEIKSNEVVSPYKQRIIITNGNQTKEEFDNLVRELNRSLNFKGRDSNGGMNANNENIHEGFVRILDIYIHP